MAEMDGSHPRLQFDVEYPESLSRWMIFVKWLLAIPHYLVLVVLLFCLYFTTIVAWFAILITGNYPRGLWDFAVGVLRWQARVNAYVGLQRDEYPPFAFDDPYPVNLSLSYPTSLSRLLLFIKWLLIIPHALVLYVLGMAASIVSFIAFFAILITGRYPEGMFRFYTGYTRWSNRASAYTLLLTDDYPPFTLDAEPGGYSSGPSTGQAVSYN